MTDDLLTRLTRALADHYSVERELGRGGMATVFLAEEQHPKRHVAIKVLDPTIAAVLGPERFLREVDLASKLTHPMPILGKETGNRFGIPARGEDVDIKTWRHRSLGRPNVLAKHLRATGPRASSFQGTPFPSSQRASSKPSASAL